jgi:very-short-patch-repair endonuclease
VDFSSSSLSPSTSLSISISALRFVTEPFPNYPCPGQQNTDFLFPPLRKGRLGGVESISNHYWNRIIKIMLTHEEIIKRARELRGNMTIAELKLWAEIKGEQLNGVKYRRQHPIPPYIVDFYAPQLKLVVEIDGDTHDEQKEYDARRDNFLKNKGYEVLRFTNEAIHQDLEGVLEILRDYCARLGPPPSLPL